MKRPKLAPLVCLAFLGLAARAQQNLVIQTETRVVLVDAVATGKKGEYVRDLSAKDFRVFEDNKEQTLKSFSFEAGSAASQPRYLVLFFDDASMEPGDQILARQAASNFIDANSGPNRMIAVVNYNGTLQVGQNFTDNAGRLKDAVNRARLSPVSQPAANNTTTAAADLGARDMIRSFRVLAKNLVVLPGRKIVVLLSGGLASTADQRAEVVSAIDACNKSDVAVYPIDVRPLSIQGGASDPGNPVPVGPASRRAPAMSRGVQTLQGQSEATPSTPEAGAGNQQILFGLANGTGGFVIHNSSELLGGLQRIGEEQGQYYVLSYTPPESKEGSCHTLRVKVDRSGTTVRARSNYCTAKPLDLLAGTSMGKDLEARAASAPAGGIAASMQLPYFYVQPNVARVNLTMEIAPDALKFENQKGKLHAEINLLGIATAPDNGVGARFSDSLKLDFDNQAQIQKLKEKPLHYEKEFKIAPGQYNFTMAFSSGGASFGKLEMPLAVEPWTPGELALSGLVLSREIHPQTDLGLGLDGLLIEDRTPLIADGFRIIPASSNVLAKAEPAFFYFELYQALPLTPDPPSVSVRARILDRKTEEAKWDGGLLKLNTSQHAQGAMIPGASNLPVSSLTPGSYRLEVSAIDSTGKEVSRAANFELK